MFFGVTGKKFTMYLVSTLDPTLVLALHPTLVPTLRIAQKRKASWWLWYWWPVMDKLGTWVVFIIAPSSY